jgi:hypothetical protein
VLARAAGGLAPLCRGLEGALVGVRRAAGGCQRRRGLPAGYAHAPCTPLPLHAQAFRQGARMRLASLCMHSRLEAFPCMLGLPRYKHALLPRQQGWVVSKHRQPCCCVSVMAFFDDD